MQPSDSSDSLLAFSHDSDEKEVVEENKQYITPYAFSVPESLYGTPLASPTKRGIAICIDMFCVMMLTTISSLFLAGFVAVAFFRAGSKNTQNSFSSKVKKLLRFFAAILLFMVAFGLFEEFNNSQSEPMSAETAEKINKAGSQVVNTVAQALIFSTSGKGIMDEIAAERCDDPYQCWLDKGLEITEGVELTETSQEFLDVYLGMSEDSLNAEQRQTLTNVLLANFEQPEQEENTLDIAQTSVIQTDIQSTEPEVEEVAKQEDTSQPPPGILAWVKSIIDDLGLGFGWAAAYFTVFTVWLGGKTPGKRLMGLKVIKLDGELMNLWESFGRYGGYGAGFATGLLGFLQIYWDANRQTIQDKISETLVIDTRRPKIKLDSQLNEVE